MKRGAAPALVGPETCALAGPPRWVLAATRGNRIRRAEVQRLVPAPEM